MPKTSLVKRVAGRLLVRAYGYLQSVMQYGGQSLQGVFWPGAVLESFTGAWQQNVVAAPTSTLLSFSPVYSCITGISNDIAKMRVKLSRNEDGVWEEVTSNQPWLPLLRNPNGYQDRIKFFESWMLSKLMYGNTYILKKRDARGVVNELYVLHPACIRPLVAEDGSVFYRIERDDLSGVTEDFIEALRERYGDFAIPASEMIHDRMNTLWHPLVGVSPLYACGTSATLGGAIQSNSTNFFSNRSMPGGMLSSPNPISQATAERLKAAFEANFSGSNVGKLFVGDNGLEFKPFSVDAQHAQLKEQFDLTVDDVARAFRYPRWKLGGSMPPYTKPDQAQTQYYVDCLQSHIEAIELCLDNGLELPLGLGTEFDLDSLMRMDTQALFESNKSADGWMTPDEQRFRANYPKLAKGGDTVYKQHQDYPIEVIADRKDITTGTTPTPTQQTDPMPEPAPPMKAAEPPSRITVKLWRSVEKTLKEPRPA